MRPGIDLVVVNYQTPWDLDNFVHSLIENEPTVKWSLTILNNNPTEQDQDIGDKWLNTEFPIRHLYFDDNMGYAHAVNEGAYIGNRECLGIFNADVLVTPGAIDSCFVNLMGNPEWGVLGPRQVDTDGLITAGGIFGTNNKPQHRAWKQKDNASYADIRDDAVTVAGSAYFIKREVWEELTLCPVYRKHTEANGAFLPTQHYYEETWCSYHARAHGWKVVYFGIVKMIHKWHKASPVGGIAEREWMPQSQKQFQEMCALHDIICD